MASPRRSGYGTVMWGSAPWHGAHLGEAEQGDDDLRALAVKDLVVVLLVVLRKLREDERRVGGAVVGATLSEQAHAVFDALPIHGQRGATQAASVAR